MSCQSYRIAFVEDQSISRKLQDIKKGPPTGGPRLSPRRLIHLGFGVFSSLPAISLNVAPSLVPSVVAPVMIASAMRAAIRPYSMAVAPDSSLLKRLIRLVIFMFLYPV